MPRSGRSILPPRQHRRDPLRLRPLATLDGTVIAAQESTHRTAAPDLRAGGAPQSSHTPVAAQDPSPWRSHSATRRLGVLPPLPPPLPVASASASRPSCTSLPAGTVPAATSRRKNVLL